MVGGSSTFVWVGELGNVPPRTMLERCIALRISGRAEVKSGTKRAQVDLLGGDVVGIDGVDPEALVNWSAGSFRVAQSLPDFNGRLTDDRERRGQLADFDSSRLMAWAKQPQLSVTLDLQSGARRALVEIENGSVIRITLDGKPAGTAQIHAWRSGTYTVVLMPLFPEPSMRIPVVDLSEPMPRIEEPEPAPLPPAPQFLPRKVAPQLAAQPAPQPTPRPAPQPALQPVHPAPLPMTTAPTSGEYMDDDVLLPSLKKNRGLRAVVVGALVIGGAGLLLVVTSSKPVPK